MKATTFTAKRFVTVGALVAALGLAGCQTGGKGATTGALIGGGVGCAAGAAISDNRGAGCLIGGAFGAIAGAIIGDAIEKQQRERVVYRAARSGGGASTGTFRNSKKQRVSYRAKVTDTYKKPFDNDLSCRSIQIDKTVDGKSAGSSTDKVCQVRVAGRATWESPEG